MEVSLGKIEVIHYYSQSVWSLGFLGESCKMGGEDQEETKDSGKRKGRKSASIEQNASDEAHSQHSQEGKVQQMWRAGSVRSLSQQSQTMMVLLKSGIVAQFAPFSAGFTLIAGQQTGIHVHIGFPSAVGVIDGTHICIRDAGVGLSQNTKNCQLTAVTAVQLVSPTV